MCLAIYKPAGKYVDRKYLENGFENHSDGAGIAWAVDGELRVKKGMFKIDEVLELYEQVKEYPCLIHFRKATHGKIDESNCHPFLFNDGKLALIHNGVLPIKCHIDGLSDTAHFVKLVMEPMVKIYNVPINNGAFNYLISTSIGSDKMAVMDGNGTTFIFNADKGTLDEGVWYSNTTFRYTHHKTTSCYIPTKSSTIATHREYDYAGSNSHSAHSNTGSNWRKNWDSTETDDESYLDFWKKTLSGDVSTTTASEKLQSSRRLLTEGSNTAIIDAEEVDETVDSAGNVLTNPKFTEGQMCEYGWYDIQIEEEIEEFKKTLGLNHEEAIIRVFNDK